MMIIMSLVAKVGS